MKNCYICSKNADSEAVIMINGREAPLCGECDNLLATIYEGDDTERDEAIIELEGKVIQRDASSAVKLEISRIIRDAIEKRDNEFSLITEQGKVIDNCSICGQPIYDLDGYTETSDHLFLCEKCAEKAGIYSESLSQYDLVQVQEQIQLREEYGKLTNSQDLQRLCGNQLLISESTGKFVVTSNDYEAFNIASLSNIIEIKYVDDVQTKKVQTRAESSGAGSAVLGAVLFGGVGMVAGGLMGRKSAQYEDVTYISNCGFIVTYQSGDLARINLLDIIFDCQSVSPTSEMFRQAQSLATAMCNELSRYIVSKKTEMGKSQSTKSNDPDNIVEQLTKMAELVKQGFLTREEYDAVKKKIIGL